MIKFKGDTIRFIVSGRLKNNPIGRILSRDTTRRKDCTYEIEYSIRFPHKYNNEESRWMFMPITLSLFHFGIRSQWDKLAPAEVIIEVDSGQIINGNFLASVPFIVEKKNKDNVYDSERRKVTVTSKKELVLGVPNIKRTSNPLSFEIYDINVTKK